MLNANNERELCYLVVIDSVEPIEGSDNCESANVSGWHVMVRKNTYKAGSIAVYFEIDSHVDETNPVFAFLSKKKFAVKTQKYTFGGKGNFVSQGLLMNAQELDWKTIVEDNQEVGMVDPHNEKHLFNDESRFLTKELKVIYHNPADNARKYNGPKPEALFTQRHPKFVKTKLGKFLMRHKFTRNILLKFFNKKAGSTWPEWVKKTDEERCQNMPQLFNPDGDFQRMSFWATEKIDGTSTTFTMRRRDKKLIVCSRNVAFVKGKKDCFYDTNVYLEMAKKYNMDAVLKQILNDHRNWEYITIQAETYGEGIQQRNYSINGHDMAIFNVIFKPRGKGEIPLRMNPQSMEKFCKDYQLPPVPVLKLIHLPATCDELVAAAAGKSKLDGLPREGLVLRSFDGNISFKAVDNNYLMQYHG